jgi:hypothetical protein
MQYHDVISKDKFDLGRALVIKHKIKMRDGQPLHARQFRIPFAHEETIFDYVDELLRRGAIEVSLRSGLRVRDVPDDAARPLGGQGELGGRAGMQ